DLTAPVAPLVAGLTAATDTGKSTVDGLTNDPTPTITGTSENNAIVQILDNGAPIGATVASAAGAWSFAVPIALADGAHILTAKATDAAGNTGVVSAGKTITVDTVVPVAPVVSGL